MANKTYTVVKDGETVKELKTLTVAKKLADEQGGEVLCEGETVYAASPIEPQAEEPVEEKIEEPVVEKYTLTARMNVRTAPSLDAPKLGVAQAGTEVEVAAVENDWLHLTNGAYILYGDGKFAKKND
jgi:hypothetical protein